MRLKFGNCEGGDFADILKVGLLMGYLVCEGQD
jgi:hypothetical protein